MKEETRKLHRYSNQVKLICKEKLKTLDIANQIIEDMPKIKEVIKIERKMKHQELDKKNKE